jgi:hypothetical protein
MVCLGNICINTLHEGDNDDDNHHHHHHEVCLATSVTIQNSFIFSGENFKGFEVL